MTDRRTGSRQVLASPQARRRAHAPMATMRPLCSATAMNSVGATLPRLGWVHRMSASNPPWKVRSLREQSRGWDETGLTTAITAVARADADVKGQAGDASYALERMVLTVSGARRG